MIIIHPGKDELNYNLSLCLKRYCRAGACSRRLLFCVRFGGRTKALPYEC